MLNDPIVIVGAARTPMGGFQGDFASLAASELGAVAIKAAVERAGISPTTSTKSIMGCVLPAGQGQAPARQAALKAGLPLVGRLHDGQQDVRLGDEGGDARARRCSLPAPPTSIVAGGMESMTQRAVPAAEGARAATGWATSRCSTTCSSTASRTPTTRAG